jgi:hypothetical protein
MVELFLFFWWMCGIFSYIHWWTNEYDLDVGTLGFSFIIGIIGPLAYIIGYFIHSDTSNTILIKKR